MTCYVLHSNISYDKQIESVKDSMLMAANEPDRFLATLASLACNFIAGKIVSAATGAVDSAMARTKSRMSAEWHVAASRDYFYDNISTNGFMDMKGMSFNGFRVVRAIPNQDNTKVDTAFYLSCHIDESRIDELVKNSTFRLVLDTLRIDLNKTKAKLPKKRDYKLDVTIRILASWATQSAEYYKDQELGSFKLTLPISKDQRNDMIYICTKNIITGYSFIIPRSYGGSITDRHTHRTTHFWGRGEYSIEINVKEQSDSKNTTRDLLYEYLQQVNSLAGSKAMEFVNQYTSFGSKSTATSKSGAPNGQMKK